MTAVSTGLVGLATYLPEQRMEAAEIAARSGLPEWVVREKLGIRQKVVGGPEDHPQAMAVAATTKLLRDLRWDPENIDVVISITEEYKEYPLWSTGIALQEAIGARRAFAFDVAQRCGTGVLALRLARDLIVADPAIRTVLVAGGYRNVDLVDYRNPRVRFLYNLGAGAGAFLLTRDASRNRVLGTAFRTDGSFSRDVLAPRGGTIAPLAGLDRPYLDVLDPVGLKERLEQRSMANFLAVVDEALEKSGLGRSDIGYVSLLHMKRSAHLAVLEALGLRPEQSIYLEDYGHIGQIDQILSTELALRAGRIRDGTVVVWVSAGIGYAWSAAVLRWGGGEA